LSDLNKRFGDTQVLHDVNLRIAPGEIHGLAGQNGSGKSTVIKILTGVYKPDTGAKLEIDGAPMAMPARWEEIHRAGVSVVHQDLGILDQLSVAENVCVGGFQRRRFSGAINRARRDAVCSDTLARVGATVGPRTIAASLGAADRAEVAIARALRDHRAGEGLIILDEATRSLSGADRERIHDLLRRVVAEGSSVLMISHNLAELSSLADRVSVLRDGRLVASGLPASEAGPEEIARYMLGGTIDMQQRAAAGRRAVTTSPVVAARVSGLRSEGVHAIDFDVHAGEILGITGLPGSGYEDVPYLMTGAMNAREGRLSVGGQQLDLARCRPRQAIAAGMVLIPERRDRDGVALEMTVRDNLSLPSLRGRSKRWFVGLRWQNEMFARFTELLSIKTAGPMSLIRELSGGNQQKVLLAKWLSTSPRVLVAHEPTQAVDVGARNDILNTLRGVAANEVAVVLVSSETKDLVDLCDRILIYDRATGLVPTDTRSEDELIDEIYARSDAPGGAER
jgi:ribose transport system ATP-binding protein